MEQERERHAEDKPVDRVRLDEIQARARGEQRKHRRLRGEDHHGVRVAPQRQGGARCDERARHAQARAQQLQGEQGKNAAEHKIGVV